MQYLISTLPEGAEDYMRLTDEGYLDSELLEQFESDDPVFQSILEVAKSDKVVKFRTATEFKRVMSDGSVKTFPMAKSDATGGIMGYFLHPEISPTGETAVLISPNVSGLKRAKYVGHEFVHASWYLRGAFNPFHRIMGGVETNIPLLNAIKRNEVQALENYIRRLNK